MQKKYFAANTFSDAFGRRTMPYHGHTAHCNRHVIFDS